MTRHFQRRLRGISAVAFLILLFTPPAVAHTDLVSAVPEVDSQLEALPKSVTIEFSEELLILADETSSFVSVIGSAGERVDDGQSKVVGRTLSVGLLDSDAYGDFEVSWRTVAQDGHPVEGAYSFSVTRQAAASPQAGESAAPSLGDTAVAPEEQSEGARPYLQILIIGLAALIGLTALVLRWRRNGSG